MEFNQLLDFTDYRVEHLYKAYCETFPETERRDEAQFEQLFDKEKVKVFSVLNNADLIGYFILWDLDGFAFLEHFEVFAEFRNTHLGSEIINKIVETYFKIVLETETESLNKEAKRRIDFYQKNGFHQISDSYVQPSYGDGKTSLQLLLFANFEAESLERITENIYDVVYGKY